ncbi:MAG: Uma2 family endonuclease [Cyanophyceae cyanobacterium]
MIETEAIYSFEEYCQYDNGTENRYELVDGKLELMNPPRVRHLLIAKYLEQCFDAEIERRALPWVCFKEAGVRTGWQKSRLADLLIIPREAALELLDQTAIFQTVPQLVVEIVSPDSVTRDYRYKRSEYAASGVPEYWIVDPLEKRVTVLILNEGLYDEMVFTGEDRIISNQLELAVAVKQVLASGLE